MSGQNQISGRLARTKPWQFAVIGGVTVMAVALIPTLNRLTERKKAEDTTAATLAASSGSQGTPWHAPAFPAPETTPVVYRQQPPPPPPIMQQPALITSPPMATGGGPSPAPDLRMFGQRSQSPQSPPAVAEQGGGGGLQAQHTAAASDGTMGALLKPTETSGFSASRMAHPWATIEDGRVIACNSVTPMTSELPGFVKAKVTHAEPSADGTVTLIDRNSDIFGEISHGLVNGQDRLFVLWRRILTPPPDLVRITINSPAADELGESGLPGDINHHTWKRIGAAAMLSGIETLGQGISQYLGSLSSKGNNSGSGGAGLNFYSFQGQGSNLASSLLQHTVDIPDTLHRDQALPCSIIVAGDLDFSSVYSLRKKQ